MPPTPSHPSPLATTDRPWRRRAWTGSCACGATVAPPLAMAMINVKEESIPKAPLIPRMWQLQGGVRVHVRRRARGIGLGMRRGGGVSGGSRRWRRRRCGTGEGGREEGEGNGVARARGTDLLRGGVSTAVQAMADTLGELRRNRRGLGQSGAARLLHRWLRGTVRGTWRTPLKHDFSTKDDVNNEINWGVEMTLP